MKITLFWKAVLHISFVDESSHQITKYSRLSILEHLREHVGIFWAGQLSHFKFSLTMSKVLKNVCHF